MYGGLQLRTITLHLSCVYIVVFIFLSAMCYTLSSDTVGLFWVRQGVLFHELGQLLIKPFLQLHLFLPVPPRHCINIVFMSLTEFLLFSNKVFHFFILKLNKFQIFIHPIIQRNQISQANEKFKQQECTTKTTGLHCFYKFIYTSSQNINLLDYCEFRFL